MHESRPPLTDLRLQRPTDYRAIYHLFRERAWVVVLCLLVTGLATATILLRSPNVYSATTVLMVEDAEPNVVDIQRVQTEDLQSSEALKTVEQTLQTRALLERVIDANNLTQDPRLVDRPGSNPLAREQLASRLAKIVEVKLRRGTRLIDITVEHTDPALTVLIANSLVTQFLLQDDEQNAEALHAANSFLDTQAQEIKAKLDGAESALQSYREATQSGSSTDTQNLVTQELDALSTKATEAKSQRIACETAYNEVKMLGGDFDDLSVSSAATDSPEIKELRSSISKAEADFASLKLRYGPDHPSYLAAESKLADLKETLHQTVLALPQTTFSAYKSAAAAEQALDTALAEQQNAAVVMEKKAIRYDVLARDVESDRALYQTVLTRIKGNTVIKDLKTSNIRVIEKAELPDHPVSPNKLEVVIMGLFCALLLSCLLVFSLNSLDQSLKTVSQTEEILGLPVLCGIPQFSSLDADAHLIKTEAFRTMRACLSMLGSPAERRVFLFTSSVPGEGKTFSSLNYALSLAQRGLKTLLIDGDMRRPMIERLFCRNNERSFGLTDYLTTHKTFSEINHPTEELNLFYVPRGSNAPNPVELLTNGRFDHLIKDALTRFDRIVIDSAPIQVVSDTLLVLNQVQTVCLVVSANHTPKNAVVRTVQILQQARAPLAGIVLNMLPSKSTSDYYYDYVYRDKYVSPTP